MRCMSVCSILQELIVQTAYRRPVSQRAAHLGQVAARPSSVCSTFKCLKCEHRCEHHGALRFAPRLRSTGSTAATTSQLPATTTMQRCCITEPAEYETSSHKKASTASSHGVGRGEGRPSITAVTASRSREIAAPRTRFARVPGQNSFVAITARLARGVARRIRETAMPPR